MGAGHLTTQILLQKVMQKFPVLPGPVTIAGFPVSDYRGLLVTRKSLDHVRGSTYWNGRGSEGVN